MRIRSDHRQSLAVMFLGPMLCFSLVTQAGSDKNENQAMELRTERVVIFKDGYALFIKQATGTADQDGRLFTDEVPIGAVLGTFWASTKDNRAVDMQAEWIEQKKIQEEETVCTTIVELMRANKGKKVTLGLIREKSTPLNGTLVDILELPPLKPKKATTRVVGPAGEHVRDLIPRGGHLVVLKTEHGQIIMPINEVRTINGADLKLKMIRKKEVTTKSKRLTFDIGKKNAGKKVTLQLLYFSEGVRWIPTYRISGELTDKAQIALQGEILNEAEDFDSNVDLVVGVPNFRFKNVASPLTLEQTLRRTLIQAAPALMTQSYSNASFQPQRARNGGRAPRANLNMAPELAGAQQQDLFVYSAKRMNLKKGARASMLLWQNEVPLKHLYTMNVNVVRDARSGSWSQRSSSSRSSRMRNRSGASPITIEENQVWHQFELTNSSDVPWTTGAALSLKNHLPMGQDLLTYTPAGGKVLLPVTIAVNMCGTFKEEELQRVANAKNWNRTNYAKISKRGTVTVSNLRKDISRTRVTISLGGKATLASDKGKIIVNDFRSSDWQNSHYGKINNHSDIRWDLELKPGETKTLTFEFSFYVQ